jgi:tetratricopeptide (TPR) repeat protein
MIFAIFSTSALAQESESLKEGILLYNKGSYEEALVALTKARQEDPSSAEAALYLGMAYRQTNDIPKAYKHFENAVTLNPLSDNAILELIESSTLLDKFDTAGKWISIAEKNRVYPARVAFLKGTALAKQAKYNEAIAAFEECKNIDPAYVQSADFQIGVCYMNLRKYTLARDRFQAAVTQDPLSDMASYARRYQDAAEHGRYIERPLRLTVDIIAQYDTNYRMLAEIHADAPQAFNDFLESQGSESLVLQNIVRLDYVPILPDPFIFNATYAVVGDLHQRYGTFNDTFSNSFTIAPGINFDSVAVNLVANYTHKSKSEPGYQRHSELATVGPLLRYLLSNNRIIEAGVSFVKKNYFRPVLNPENEDESSRGWDSSLNWIWLFREKALFNLKIDYTTENAVGRYYDNNGYRFSAGFICPFKDILSVQLGCDYYLQEYEIENLPENNTVREDRTYTGTVGLTWSFFNKVDVIAQYLYTRAHSNIYIYDYKRSITTVRNNL